MRAFFFALLSGAALAAPCQLRPDQDAANARAIAVGAANAALQAAAYSYALRYSNLSYQVLLGPATIAGNQARVAGRITVQGVNRATGQRESNVLRGTVTLQRAGCTWRAAGYQPG